MPGDDTQTPIIMFGGNASHACGKPIEFFTASFACMYKKLPTIYSMNYGGRGKARESTIISNAARLILLVYGKHKRMPHIFGVSLGCAVSIGAIRRLGMTYSFPSLTLIDPFKSMLDVVKRFPMGGWASYFFKRKGTNNWLSYQRVQHEVFLRIPTIVFSATKDDMIPPEQHLRIFSELVGTGEVFSETSSSLKLTKRESNLGAPRLLVQVKTGHQFPAMTVLRQGNHNDMTKKKCRVDSADSPIEDNCLHSGLTRRVQSLFKRFIVNGAVVRAPSPAGSPPALAWRPSNEAPTANGHGTNWSAILMILACIVFSTCALLCLCLLLWRKKRIQRKRRDIKRGK